MIKAYTFLYEQFIIGGSSYFYRDQFCDIATSEGLKIILATKPKREVEGVYQKLLSRFIYANAKSNQKLAHC